MKSHTLLLILGLQVGICTLFYALLMMICLDLLHSKWLNSNKLNISDTKLLQVYFEMLSDEDIRKLYNIYEADFKQFQYNFDFRGIKYG